MTGLRDVRAVLETHLTTLPGLPPVAYDSAPYEQLAGTAYVEVGFSPTSTVPQVCGPAPAQRYQGLFNILIYTPQGEGTRTAYDLAGALLVHFPSAGFLGTTPEVGIEYSEVMSGFSIPPFHVLPVTVGWFAIMP